MADPSEQHCAHGSSEGQREASIENQFRKCEHYVKRQAGWDTTRRYYGKAISGSHKASVVAPASGRCWLHR